LNEALVCSGNEVENSSFGLLQFLSCWIEWKIGKLDKGFRAVLFNLFQLEAHMKNLEAFEDHF
jgi:hypothetical protein